MAHKVVMPFTAALDDGTTVTVPEGEIFRDDHELVRRDTGGVLFRKTGEVHEGEKHTRRSQKT